MIRRLIQDLQGKFMQHFVPSKDISHDEAMGEYFGQNCSKHAIRNKPVRLGTEYGATIQTLVCAFDVYQGKTFKSNGEIEKCFLQLQSSYDEEEKALPYHIFL